jgi:hypothetical protein
MNSPPLNIIMLWRNLRKDGKEDTVFLLIDTIVI